MSLRIKVIEVRNVPHPNKYHIVDPYLSMQLSSGILKQRTRVIDNSSDPIWNEEFTFPLVNLSTDVLNCSLIDRNVFSEDQDLAKVDVHVSDIPHDAYTLDRFYDMQSLYPSNKTTQIHLILKLVTGPPPQVNPMMAPMMGPQQPQMNSNMMMMMQNPMMNPMMGVNPQMMGNQMNQMNPQMMGSSMMNTNTMGMQQQNWGPYRYPGQ